MIEKIITLIYYIYITSVDWKKKWKKHLNSIKKIKHQAVNLSIMVKDMCIKI